MMPVNNVLDEFGKSADYKADYAQRCDGHACAPVAIRNYTAEFSELNTGLQKATDLRLKTHVDIAT